MGTTLAEKVWADHLVRKGSDGAPDLLYIDLMLMHEVTSPQAFEGLRLAGRKPRHVDQLIATEDHNTPTVDIDRPNPDETSALQLSTLEKNCKDFGVRLCPLGDADQGVVHAFAPVLGLTQPGMTIVCGDSHTSTHGAFGALAFGIGTSEVEHVLATQTLPQAKPKTMAVNINGELPDGVTAKDVVLALIAKVGTGGGQGYIVEYRGTTIENLSMEGRMTICNMSIEWGAKAGMIAPDETTFAYLKGRPHAPEGADWDAAMEYWQTLHTDDDAVFDTEVYIDATKLTPFVTWGTNPGQGVSLSESVPDPASFTDPNERAAAERALEYMDLRAGTPMKDVTVDAVFMGSCTNSRIEDLRAIPWGFSWGQCRLTLPGWYGFGSAIQAFIHRPGKDAKAQLALLQKMYRQWPFFRTLLSNMDMVLAKSDLALASRYSELVTDARLRKRVFSTIEAEWHRTADALTRITGDKQRLTHNTALARSIRHRFPYIDPLHHLQVELVRRWRAGQGDERVQTGIHISINGIAAGLRNTG